MRYLLGVAFVLGCSSASITSDPTPSDPQALTTEVVCQIGPVDQQDPHAGNSTCEQYPWSWSDSAGTFTKCTDAPCIIGDACHIMGGVFGKVVSGACASPEQVKPCDSTSPWVWVDQSGSHSCLIAPPNGATCWQLVNGTCRLATFP
jgi:hypothetical protein